jgi:type VI secretion system protein VasG
LSEALGPELLKYFKPAFLGRVTLVPYLPLSEGVIREIVELQLSRIQQRVYESYRAQFEYEPALIETIAARCTETASGARNIEKILSRTLLPELSAEVLARLVEGQPISRVRVGMNPAGSFCYTIR